MSKDTQLIRSIAWAHRKNWKPPGRVGFARLSSGSKGKVRNSKGKHEPPNLAIQLQSQVGSSYDRNPLKSRPVFLSQSDRDCHGNYERLPSAEEGRDRGS